MKPALRIALRAVAAVALVVLLWVTWQWIRPIPALNVQRFTTLASAGQIQAAEDMLRSHLRRAPDDPYANFLLATIFLDNPDAAESDEAAAEQAAEALSRLARFRPDSPVERALLKLYEGKALYILKRWGAVEARMLEALELDPMVPEAGWALLDLYYLQGRSKEASELALKLHESEPDPRDRAHLLLEMVRQDAQPPDAASLVELFRPVLQAEPENVRAATALGTGLIRDSKAEEGLDILRQTVEAHPEDPTAWEGLMTGLDEAGQLEALAETLEQIPSQLADDPRFAGFRGRIAQERGDWPVSAEAYRRAFEHDPHDPILLYRLSRALRFAGETAESDRLMITHERYQKAMRDVRPLYDEANAIATLGVRSYPELYRRLADNRELLLWPEQAAAWRRLAESGLTASSSTTARRPRLAATPGP